MQKPSKTVERLLRSLSATKTLVEPITGAHRWLDVVTTSLNKNKYQAFLEFGDITYLLSHRLVKRLGVIVSHTSKKLL